MLVSISVSDGRESVLAGGVWIVDMLEQRIRGCEDYVLLITACTVRSRTAQLHTNTNIKKPSNRA